MKKKILFSVLVLFIASLFFVRVSALDHIGTVLGVPNNTKAKSPDPIPTTDEILYGTITDDFNFSKIKFSNPSGEGTVDGKEDFRKIVLGRISNFEESIFEKNGLNIFDKDKDNNPKYFTAYCLNQSKKYPGEALFGFMKHEASGGNYEFNEEEMVYAAIGNDKKIQNVLKSKGLDSGTITSIQDVNYTFEEGEDIVEKASSLNETVTVYLEKVTFYRNGIEEHVIKASDITSSGSEDYHEITTGDVTTGYYVLKFTGKDILLDKYNVTDSKAISEYDHALWIIEHSYPTLSLNDSLMIAGADYDALRKEVCELEGKTFDDEELTCTGLEKLDDYVENYVYATIQYAIWKTTGYGDKVGNEITNSVELNKLYRFLLEDRTEYNGYSSKTFTNKITIKAPKDGKEVYKETSDKYMYGPYKVTSDVLSGGDISLSIKNSDKNGIKLVNKNGEEITTIQSGGEFYIECTKSAKISSVEVGVKSDIIKFSPATNRGRIYYPRYVVEQNVMSGGDTVGDTIEANVELIINPKTGVENIALLLLVTLVAFTLAYIVLSYKQKPVQLN